MAVTQIDLDDEALAEVMKIAGVRTELTATEFARQWTTTHQPRVAWRWTTKRSRPPRSCCAGGPSPGWRGFR